MLGYFAQLKLEWPALKTVKASFLTGCLIVATLTATGIFFAVQWHYDRIIDAQDKTIQGQATTIQQWKDDYAKLEKENEKLQRQLADPRIIQQESAPLKKRTQVLVKQLREFSKKWLDKKAAGGAFDWNGYSEEYERRFSSWVPRIIAELDQAGQHSDKLDGSRYYGPDTPEHIEPISVELEALADKL